MTTGPRFGRFGEAALWIHVALAGGPQPAAQLMAEIRRRDVPLGPGTLFGAIARLERAALIERIWLGSGAAAYRLVLRRMDG